MGLSPYLAMTAAEIRTFTPLPPKLAYMACHFSPYGTGLSNLPEQLPEGSLLILNDRTPIFGHDPQLILEQLRHTMDRLRCGGLLLDFQRPDQAETAALTAAVVEAFPQAAVTDLYAEGLTCPVFLPPPPLIQTLDHYLFPWQGREIWLEAALDAALVTVTADGSRQIPLFGEQAPDNVFEETDLHCCYRAEVLQDEIRFYLYRKLNHLRALLAHAESLGVTAAVGLYQQLGREN